MKITQIDCHVLLDPGYDVGATSSSQDDLVVEVQARLRPATDTAPEPLVTAASLRLGPDPVDARSRSSMDPD